MAEVEEVRSHQLTTMVSVCTDERDSAEGGGDGGTGERTGRPNRMLTSGHGDKLYDVYFTTIYKKPLDWTRPHLSPSMAYDIAWRKHNIHLSKIKLIIP